MTHNRELVAKALVASIIRECGRYPYDATVQKHADAILAALSPSVDANDHTMSGALVFAGTRVMVSSVLQYIRAGSDNATIRAAYPDVTDDQIEGCRRLSDSLLPPVPMSLDCPACGVKHIDEGEWATRPHKTHQCQSCGHEWRPYPYATVGVPSPEPEPVAWGTTRPNNLYFNGKKIGFVEDVLAWEAYLMDESVGDFYDTEAAARAALEAAARKWLALPLHTRD